MVMSCLSKQSVLGIKSGRNVRVGFPNRPWASWRKLLHVRVTLSPPATPAASCLVCYPLVWPMRRPPASLRYTHSHKAYFTRLLVVAITTCITACKYRRSSWTPSCPPLWRPARWDWLLAASSSGLQKVRWFLWERQSMVLHARTMLFYCLHSASWQ